MVHLPAQNRAIRLHNDVVRATVIDDRPLLAQRVELCTGKVTSLTQR